MSETPTEEDDATLLRRIADRRDESALKELMRRYTPKAMGYLLRNFARQLKHPDMDQAVIDAFFKVWEKAHKFDQARKFGPWFIPFVRHAALDILEREKDQPRGGLGYDLPDHDTDYSDDEPGHAPNASWRGEQLNQIIENELRGFEQILARADLAAGGQEDTQVLMKEHGKSKEVVQSTRSKVRKKIKEKILERESLWERRQVNP
jgi:RNA polymerase sigma factor (sigma-70 family)